MAAFTVSAGYAKGALEYAVRRGADRAELLRVAEIDQRLCARRSESPFRPLLRHRTRVQRTTGLDLTVRLLVNGRFGEIVLHCR
jgi:hypothetical protein